ncbi:MAG: hypothetical protein KF752_19520 [Pirellulaceae bacterium]|nr:hypothetical protein [Pirellulaceae bacterium]
MATTIAWTAQLASAQRSDSFEGGSPRWNLVYSDCNAQLTEHDISLIMPHSGRTCELLEVSSGRGEQVLLAYPIEPCAVLNEFLPELWIRCAAGQIRVGVRVVFPKAIHPVSQNRMTTVIWGDTYTQTGQWQRLQVRQIGDRLQQEIIAIRNQFDTQLNLQQSYIDSLVINAYTGPGRYRVQIDDLDLSGMIPLATVGIPLPANWRERWQWREPDGAHFGATTQYPLWIEHRGEQPGWLKSLGFTGVWLQQPPTHSDLNLIRDASLAVISPPPAKPTELSEADVSHVRGWLIGTALNRDQIDWVRQQISAAEQLPDSMRRPLYGEALENYWLFSRLAHEVIVPAPDPVSPGDAKAKHDWLSQSLDTVRVRGRGWVSLHVDVNPALAEQYRVAIESIDGTVPERLLVNPLGLRHETIAAVISGARGIVYHTGTPLITPLDFQNDEDRALQAAVRWTNGDLQIWSPWLTVGQRQSSPELSRSDFTAARWRIKNAELIVAQSSSPESRWCLPNTQGTPLAFKLSEGIEVPQVVRLTHGTLESIDVQSTGGVHQWRIDAPHHVEVLVMTRNPYVLNSLQRRLQERTAEMASDQLEVASLCLEQATHTVEARIQSAGLGQSEAQRRQWTALKQVLSGAQQQLDSGWTGLQSNRPQAAIKSALAVLQIAQSILHQSYKEATGSLPAAQSSPFVLTPGTLKYHWLVADACARSRWQPATMPGSQFDNLPDMLTHGWSQQRRLEDAAELRVELVPASNNSPSGLRLAAYAKPSSTTKSPGALIANSPASQSNPNPATDRRTETLPGGYEGASLRVRSAPLTVRRGQMIQVTAKALVRQSSSDASSGMLFYDNQAGPSLGQLIRGSAGQQLDIQLQRFVLADGEFRILAECRGECDVQIQELSIHTIQPATKQSHFETSPLE